MGLFSNPYNRKTSKNDDPKAYEMHYDLTDYNDSSKSKRCSLPFTAKNDDEAISYAEDYCNSNERRSLIGVILVIGRKKIFWVGLLIAFLYFKYFAEIGNSQIEKPTSQIEEIEEI